MFKSITVLTVLLVTVPSQPKMVKTKIGESITMMLPDNLYAMSADDISRRYPSVRQPIGAFTNESRLADFSVNISATRWRAEDVDLAKGFFKSSFYNLFDRVEMINEEVVDINDKRFIVYEFDSRLNGDPSSFEAREPILRYNYIQYLIVKGRTIVFSFNCHPRVKEDWKPVVLEMMSSIKVKGSI
ncbi:MAG: hypothetical protein AAF519_16290 [Bacteroidota bacterium]